MEKKTPLQIIVDTFVPHVMEKQSEFDAFMAALNIEQQRIIKPHEDACQKYAMQKEQLLLQIYELKEEIARLKCEWKLKEAEMKDVNRTCHNIKHETILLNPADRLRKNDE